MSHHAKVLILRTAGTNCDQETQFAFEYCGALAECVHINRILSKGRNLNDYHILAIPGGFTYGDDIASGKIMANELRLGLGDDLKKFIDDGKLVIGICNGFQILVKAGILPGMNREGEKEFSQEATLTTNDSGKFEDRWIHLKHESPCVWTKGIPPTIFLPVAHGEGKFVPQDDQVLKRLKQQNQIVFRYQSPEGKAPRYPENPNGSVDDIAGICDPTGRVLGLMPHPERLFLFTQHPFWTRLEKKSPLGDGARIFQNGVNYVREKLL